MTDRDLIVIGTSLGGVETLKELARRLPERLSATVVVVMHISAQGPTFLGDILSRVGPLPARQPYDGETLARGQIYVAEPDRHLLIHGATLRHSQAPRENRCRPAIDPLFRSAAVYGRTRTIGVVLSGLLDDGSVGLQAIRRCGGTTVVQSPADALSGDMPQNAIDAGEIDHVLPVAEMGALLAKLVATPLEREEPLVPNDVLLETRWVERAAPGHGLDLNLGHAYGLQSLISAHDRTIESAAWGGLRSLQERIRMLEALARREQERCRSAVARVYEERAAESRRHAETLRALLLSL